MRRLYFTLLLCLLVSKGTTQNKTADSLCTLLATAKDDKMRIDYMYKIIYELNDFTQQDRIDYSKKILDLAKNQKNKVLESVLTAELGYLLAYNGNKLQGTELVYSALDMALEHKNPQALGIIYNDLAICITDSIKASEYFRKAYCNALIAKDNYNLGFITGNMASWHNSQGRTDSALYYAQRGYELARLKNIEAVLPYNLSVLADIHYYSLGDKALGYEFIRKSMSTKFGQENMGFYIINQATIANYFHNDNSPDSALYYTTLAARDLNRVTPYHALGVYNMYRKIYANINSDSALKYYQLYDKMKNEIATLSNVQQEQLLTIKKEIELENEATLQKQIIQFSLIACGILLLVMVFLLLSRTIVVKENTVSFLTILGLLIVFEFINLIIHPFLGSITHHSPILMLLAMVLIASMLIPLHHRLEHWIKTKMIEKNKSIRLAAAKRTIEELEKRE